MYEIEKIENILLYSACNRHVENLTVNLEEKVKRPRDEIGNLKKNIEFKETELNEASTKNTELLKKLMEENKYLV